MPALPSALNRSISVSPLRRLPVAIAFVVVLLAPVSLAAGLQLPPDAPSWWALAFIVLGPSVGSYVCWNLAVTRVAPGTAGAAMNLVTVFVLVIAAILGTPPTPVQLLGGAMVIGGVLLAQQRSPAQDRPPRRESSEKQPNA